VAHGGSKALIAYAHMKGEARAEQQSGDPGVQAALTMPANWGGENMRGLMQVWWYAGKRGDATARGGGPNEKLRQQWMH